MIIHQFHTMQYFSFLLLLLLAFSCKSKPESAKINSKDSIPVNTVAWPKEEENEFLADCVEKAMANLPEDSAYMRCNCVLKQLKQQYPSLDSASTALLDTARAAALAANCR